MDWFIRVINVYDTELEWNETYMKQMCWDFRKNLEDFLEACQHTKNDEKLKDLSSLLRESNFKHLKIEEHPFLQYVKNNHK